MFIIHIPYRTWHKENKVSMETIADVNEYMWEILPELVPGEHIIIECKDGA